MNKIAPGLLADAGGRLTRTALIVAGMHRSGTSALARTIALLGADLPRTLMAPGSDNPKGFWESAVFADANDKVLEDLNSSWDDPLSMLVRRREMSAHPGAVGRIRGAIASEFSTEGAVVVAKEPRIALLLDLWLQAFAAEGYNARVIVPVRNPLEVAASLAARNGFAVGRSLLLWLTYFLAAERSSRASRRVFVSYTDLLGDWRGAMSEVERSLGVAFPGWNPTSELAVDGFLSSDDRHQVVSIEQLNARGDIVEWVKRAYQWALAAAVPGATPDCAPLDEIAREFETSMRVFAPLIAEQRAELTANNELVGRLRADVEQHAAVAATLQREIDQRNASVSELEQALAELRGEIDQRNASVGELEQALAELRGELDQRNASVGELEQALAELRGNIEALEERGRAQARQLELEQVERDALGQQLVALKSDIQVKERGSEEQIAALKAEVAERARILVAEQQRGEELQRELALQERLTAAAIEKLKRDEAKQNAVAVEQAKLEAQRRAEIEQQQSEIVRLKEMQRVDGEHLRALEQSARSAREHAEAEAGERRGLQTVAEAQRQFIEHSIPIGRRIRGMLWRRAWLRPLSYTLEYARLALTRGPRRAARIVWSAAALRRAKIFDEEHYLDQAWDVRALGQDPIVHYVTAGAREGRDPSPSFSTSAYLRRYPDVVGASVNPLFHYLRHGKKEGRIAAHDIAGDAADAGSIRDSANPYQVRPDDVVSREARRGEDFLARFALLTDAPDWAGAVAALNANDSARSQSSAPDVSIIIPVYGQLAYTLNCLDSVLSHQSAMKFEIIVVDDCSPDASRAWLSRVRGITLHERSQNGGFIAACNDGALRACAPYLVFLNNDTRVVTGWLDGLIKSFGSLSDAELVGSKLFYPDGSLQEAGAIIWRDGSAWNYGRNDDPGRPEYCYARPVDYVSGASIAITREVWREIGGFDTKYAPAYGEDSDLALKIRYSRNKQVWLQPLSRVIHYEGKTSGTDVNQGAKSHQIRNAQTLFETWRKDLLTHRENGVAPALEKDRNVAKRALVIDATTPEPDKDAGSLTCFELMRALQTAGFGVSFAAENLLYLADATANLQSVGIEALYYPFYQSLEQALRERGGDFDIVLIFRLDVAGRHLETVRRYCPRARVIFHCSDLHFLREERQALLSGDSSALTSAEKTKQRELKVFSSVDASIVHSTFEKDLLTDLAPGAKVTVFPWILEPVPSEIGFRDRRDIAFLGGYRHTPNVDAVLYFVEHIWPLVRAKHQEMKFIVAGSECPDELLALHGRDNIEVIGFVGDLEDFFGRLRLSVAPIRYGAGIKGKVAMSLAHGVPTVVTSCAAEGMELRDGEAVIIRDDEAGFAQALVQLYDDEEAWTRMSQHASRFVELTYGSAAARRKVKEMLDLAGVPAE